WLCINHGPGIIWGNLIASTVVGTMALYFSHRFHAPPAVIAFGAVVGIVPGIFVFQAASGLIQIMNLPENASSLLLATTLGMITKALLMTLAIPVGLAIPILLRFQRESNF
ncbi:MAG: threonine/serine exporter family protein, partial [Sphaerospermopsis kisseleviana]